MPCKWVSLSVGPRWGTQRAGTFWAKRMVYLGSFLGPRGH